MELDTSDTKFSLHENSPNIQTTAKYLFKTVRMYKCMICNETFPNKTSLTEHKITHSAIKPYECSYCNYKSSLKDIMKNHISIQHGVTLKLSDIATKQKYEMIVQEYKCTICNMQFSNKKALHEHHSVNKTCKPFACSHCDIKSGTKSKNEEDDIEVENENFADIPIKEENTTDEDVDATENDAVYSDIDPRKMVIYKCTVCTMQFNSKSSLYRHNLRHFGSKPYGCQYCDYRCTLRGILKNHLEVRHGISMKIADILPDKKDKMFIRIYKCATCNKILPNRQRLRKHLATSTQCKPFKCLFCEYRSAMNCTMKRHMQAMHGYKTDMNNTEMNIDNDENKYHSEIKLEIDSSKILPELSIKEENIEDEQPDAELMYDGSAHILTNHKLEDENTNFYIENGMDGGTEFLENFVKEEIVTDDC